jgi:energy-coupling factor transporter ATP-binding protein EcfA2
MPKKSVSDPANSTTKLLRDTLAEIEQRERDKREHAWEVRKTAAECYFGRDRVFWAGRWATIFQEQFGKLRSEGKDLTSIPRYDDLALSIVSVFPEYADEGGTERLWDFLLSSHDPLPPRDEMTRRAILQVAEELGWEPPTNGHAVPAPAPKPVAAPGEALPACFDEIMDLVKARRNVLLVGPAGCGKTTVARMIAKHLGLYFGSINCTAGMSEAHLVGRSLPNISTGTSEFEGTEFLRCYEQGGLFLLDEMDAADSNVLLGLNTALSNGHCNVPARASNPRAERHPDFVLVATANTYGRGANRTYAGRNQLDEATLDRFKIGLVEMDYSNEVERVVCPEAQLRKTMQTLRGKIEKAGLRRLCSTRYLEDAAIMHERFGWSIDRLVNKLTNGWTSEEKAKVDVKGNGESHA